MSINHTYNDKRKCLQCLKSIPDQEHALRKFCKRIKLQEDGSVMSCKDDFHSAMRKKENQPFMNFASHHKRMRDSIKDLIKEKGNTVSIESINRAGINLMRPARIDILKDGCNKFYFVEYLITQTNDFQFKITKHNEIF
jgi:hypothetical protein